MFGSTFKHSDQVKSAINNLLKLLMVGALLCYGLYLGDHFGGQEGSKEDERWKTCIYEMQDKILTEMHGVLEKAQVDYDIPLVYVDPAYHGNLGDVFITYGALVLVERLGFRHHTECGIYQSWSKNYPCRRFENFPNGTGLAFFHGGK